MKRKSSEMLEEDQPSKKKNEDSMHDDLSVDGFINKYFNAKSIPITAKQHFERARLIRKRLFNQSRIYLNNSNSKWLDIGVQPTSYQFDGVIDEFTTEIFLGGEKCNRLALGGIVGFRQLIRQIRQIDEFKLMRGNTSVSIMFHSAEQSFFCV